VTSTSSAFNQRVAATARALANAGVPAQRIRLPYAGPSAQVAQGAVIPGDALRASTQPLENALAPAPSGLGYYGENDTSGTVETTTLDASSVVGSLTVNQLNTLYLDTDTPDFWGIQLNSVLTNVTLQGTRGYEFWTQNAVDYIQHNDSLSFGEDTWNFSSGFAYIAPDNSTILDHDPNGSVIAGLYIGEGPYVYAPRPFALTLYLNSSVTFAGEQELWYNYSLATPGGHRTSANYDWLVFNSSNPQHPASVAIAPFEAEGAQIDPIGLTNDFEFDFGIGAFDGSTMDVLSANVSASLDYCPAASASCSSAQFRSVPAAEDFGSETGESSSGLNIAYSGTHATATAGPFILRGLWGYASAPGSAAGSTSVSNQVTVSGDPEVATSTPYVFAFFNTSAYPDRSYEWAPDVPVWHLAPGTYHYELMLADYAERNGTLVVGATPTALSVALEYHASSGVYTPLWAFNDSELAGISTDGNGSLSNQFRLFNNPTRACDACDGAPNGSVSNAYGAWNDYHFPTFVGLLLAGTDAYVDVDHPVNFSVDYDTVSDFFPGLHFFLQIELVSTEHVTLAHDPLAGGWPLMFGIETLAGAVPASSNPFPQANVVLWNSSDDLVMSNTFVPAWSIPQYLSFCGALCPPFCGMSCPPPDGLLLFGGTRNTVWGNTFEDPVGPYAQPSPYYAGLAESESGDLLYNNNFSIDNPTMYLPFNIYYDSCPDGYAGGCGPSGLARFDDTWNVTPEPASEVSDTVNGIPLSGNILGPTCAIQGGNYWSNYGNAINPHSLLPYANIYNYTDLAGILPPGYLPVNRSIGVGGDYAPLTRTSCTSPGFYTVSFEETGLAAGTSWGVAVNGQQATSTSRWVNSTLPNGTFSYALDTVLGYAADPTNGSFTVSGASVSIAVVFSPTYTVTFTEAGLPADTNWSVTLAGEALNSTYAQIVFSDEINGTYPYSVGTVAGYTPSTLSGVVTITGGSVAQPVEFQAVRPAQFQIQFVESGLPAGTTWSVTLGGTTGTSNGTTNVSFDEINGTYPFSVENVPGYSANVTSGSVILVGHPVTLLVRYTPTQPSTQTTSGPPVVDDWIIVGVAVVAVVLMALLLLLRSRRPRPPG